MQNNSMTLIKFLYILDRINDDYITYLERDASPDQILVREYNKLSIEDRALLLRSIDVRKLESRIYSSIYSKDDDDSDEEDDITKANQLELIKLKTWIMKFFIRTAIAGIAIFIAIVIMSQNHMTPEPVNDLISIFKDIYNLLKSI